MKINYLALALALTVSVVFSSCDNPADKTTDAKISGAVHKTALPTESGTRYVFTPTSEVNFVGSKVTGSHSGGFIRDEVVIELKLEAKPEA